MPKRREPRARISTATENQPSAEQIEAFAAAADGGILQNEQKKKPTLDPQAKRDFKAIRVPFNEYEYLQLEEATQVTGRTKLNFIRYAMLKMAEETQNLD